MSLFSVEDLNDFILPSQSCIFPATQEPPQKETPAYEVTVDTKPAKINLTDCLACSGCITTSESLLVSQQSHLELLKTISQNQESDTKRTIIVSISPVSLASLAAKYRMSASGLHCRLKTVMTRIGVRYYTGIEHASQISLLESSRYALDRIRDNQVVVSSVCPGWICYAEKTHPHMLPFLDPTKSPQQIQGSLLKRAMSNIWHMCVMPCHDKKLEASRSVFARRGSRDVDCVITTHELDLILGMHNVQIDREDEGVPDTLVSILSPTNAADLIMKRPEGSSAGGYLLQTMQYVVHKLYSVTLTPLEMQMGGSGVTITRKNADHTIITYDPGMGQRVIRFAYAYGFKHIQNIVRKFKRMNVGLDYVEVMACPSACINGGGQIPAPSATSSADWIGEQSAKYDEIKVEYCPDDLKGLYGLIMGEGWKQEIDLIVKTEYFAVERTVSGFDVRW